MVHGIPPSLRSQNGFAEANGRLFVFGGSVGNYDEGAPELEPSVEGLCINRPGKVSSEQMLRLQRR